MALFSVPATGVAAETRDAESSDFMKWPCPAALIGFGPHEMSSRRDLRNPSGEPDPRHLSLNQSFGRVRHSWKPSDSTARSISRRGNLWGGAARVPSVPVSPQGAYLGGSLVPRSSPAKACKSDFA